MKVYIYVEQSRLQSIQTHGLLSARAQYEVLGAFPTEKYMTQFQSACGIDELCAYVENFRSIEEKILGYLDWRDETSLMGSRAIYFLFQPVPSDQRVRAFIKEYRDDFLLNRQLLEYDLKVPFQHVGFELSDVQEEAWWIARWLNQPLEHDLWFKNIPHGYFIPASGRIPFSQLTLRSSHS